MDEIPRVTVHDLLRQGAPDDTWLAPLDGRLVKGLALSGITMVIALVACFSLALSSSSVGWVGVAIIANIAGVLLLVSVGWKTDGFSTGPLIWHQVSAGLVGLGALDAIVLTLPLLLVVLQVVFWILVVTIIAVVFFGVLLAL